MFWYLFLIAGFLCLLHIFCNYNERARKIRKLPGPKDSFILGNAPALYRSSGKLKSQTLLYYLLQQLSIFKYFIFSVEIMELGRSLAKENSGIYRIWMWPQGAVNIYNPDDVEVNSVF